MIRLTRIRPSIQTAILQTQTRLSLPRIPGVAADVLPLRQPSGPAMMELVDDVLQAMIQTTLERRSEDVVCLAHRLVAVSLRIQSTATGSVAHTGVALHLRRLTCAMAAELIPLLILPFLLADDIRLVLPDPGHPLLE